MVSIEARVRVSSFDSFRKIIQVFVFVVVVIVVVVAVFAANGP
jgi:hypothetical protein